jgi:hypothetical protein
MKKKPTMNPRSWLRSALCGLALSGLAGSTQAQTFLTDTYTNNFAVGANTEPFADSGSVASWIYWYGDVGYGNTQMTNDITMDAGGDPTSGSLLVVQPFTGSGQSVFFGTFGNQWDYDFSVRADMTKYTNITFSIRVDTNTVPQPDGDFGVLAVGMINASYGFQEFGQVTIPGSASNGWVTLTVNVNQTLNNLANAPGIAIQQAVWQNGGSYPGSTFKYWIDNLQLNLRPGPPPPPPTITGLKAAGKTGLQVLMNDPNQWQRDAIASPAAETSVLWAGNGNTPVTYSFTIADFPDPANHEGFEAHLYLVNGDTTDAFNETYGGCDWNAPDIAIMSLQSLTNGTYECQFQFKTNLPNANPPDNPIHRPGFLYSPTVLGTWSLSFTDDTNVTMSGPGGISTNFTIPIEAVQNNFSPATSFLQFGFHKNDNENDGHNNGTVGVFSNVKKTGGSYTFDDSFTGNSLTDLYAWRKTSAVYVQHVSPSVDWDMTWTLPNVGFSPQVAPAVTGPWTDITPSGQYNAGGVTHGYVGDNFPGGAGYYRLIKRTFSKLQVLFPGETNMPDTVSGKVGTPTPVAVSTPVQVTIHAVDNDWHIIPSATASVSLSTDDPSGVVPLPIALSGGTAQDFVLFGSTGSWTVTATNTATVMPAATSSTITVN